ncbi:MAG: transglycosylase SLT domain-containing protein [Dehalococcoidia bacterium]|nr:transglycosylase SLT domain-containing protein [Dehalococcoidia bacterium]
MRPSGPPRHALILGFAAAVAVVGVACAGANSTRAPKPTTSATQAAAAGTPRPAATPTRAPADPKLAASLRYAGEYEKAIDVYAAVATADAGQPRQDALFAQAQLLSRTGRFAEARDALQSWLAIAGAAGAGSAAQYMLASTFDDLGDPASALAAYDTYIAAGGAAADFAGIERAKMLARLGRTVDAEAAAEAVIASNIGASFKASFTFSIAAAFEQGGVDANALNWYNRVAITPGGDVGSALARIGGIKKRLGDASWTADYLRAITEYPGSGSAPDLLTALDAAAVPVDDYVRGLVDYRARRDADATPALQRAIAAGAHPAEARYYLAAIEERAGDTEAAIADYALVPQTDAASPLAADALWWRGRLLDGKGDYAGAAADYSQLASQYPSSSRAADAAFRKSLAAYRSGDKATAIGGWAALAARTSGDDNLRARYWQGRTLIEQNGSANNSVLTTLAADAPDNYYGLRAQVLLKQNDTNDSAPKLDDSAPDWKKIAAWVQEQTGELPATPRFGQDLRWGQAVALADVGLGAQSDRLFEEIIVADDGDAVALYQVTKQLSDDGRTSLAARAATRLIAAGLKKTPAPPTDLLRLAYPVVYKDLVSQATAQEKVSPMLLLALVRQESYYNPDAGSSAGALGLTQVVPSTGASIAKSLGRASFTATDLFRPNVNLLFGADYLASQLADFKSDPYRALAAYNGGPGVASDAITMSGGDEDLFVEDLEFDQTQTYVKRVMENYARYRQIYQRLDAPSLPQ